MRVLKIVAGLACALGVAGWDITSGYPGSRIPRARDCIPVRKQVKRFCTGFLRRLRRMPCRLEMLNPRGSERTEIVYREATFREVEESAIPMTADILLVDDNAIQAATRKAILARTGRNVAVASDGEQALRILEEIGTDCPVSLVITDHLMPGMNGPEFVTKLRERYARMPVLVLSGLAEAENDYTDLDVMFRVKPLPPEELLELVRELMARRIARTA